MNENGYKIELDPSLSPSPVLPALIYAEGIAPPHPTVEAPPFLADAIARAQKIGEGFIPQEQRARVRRMLKHGKYRASGRGRPASEFLLRAALNGRFPLINPPVDVNNAISLETGLPGSIFDARLSGRRLLLRWGRPGESYAFNRSGQTIDLEDLLVVCRLRNDTWVPCGNPVKDAMETKISEATRDVIAVLYAPADEPPERLVGIAADYAELLRSHCKAERVGYAIPGFREYDSQ